MADLKAFAEQLGNWTVEEFNELSTIRKEEDVI